jgi:sulfur-oxidizing protein SoxY
MRHERAVSSETTRRSILQLMAGLGLYGVTAPARADNAPGWPEAAFRSENQDAALKALYGKSFEFSKDVTLETPEIAENGAVVPVSVSTKLPKVTSISLLVPENPYTLAASYKLPEDALPQVSCRLKMAKTTKVIAIVESDGKLYGAANDVKVTLGGCGG